ncbi:hypothetical protein ACMCNP_06885 [Candidatus Acidulodesulfobacterium sp. H_13]
MSKAVRNKSLTKRQKVRNKLISRVRFKVEQGVRDAKKTLQSRPRDVHQVKKWLPSFRFKAICF